MSTTYSRPLGILEKSQGQAFADDLALVVGGRTARDLEKNTNFILAETASKLESLKLSLSIQKCQAIVYRSYASQKFSKRNSTILNRKPTFRINNISIRVTDSLKILGIIIDQKLSWTAHIDSLHDKILTLKSNFNRIVKSDWSVNQNLIKTWYITTIEKALLYGASVWGGALTKIQIWVRRSSQFNHIIDSVSLDQNILIKNISSHLKFISPPTQIDNADFEVYTDGSRIENETGFAVCTFQNDQNLHNFLFKLNYYNSVFQAELAAIHHAVKWAASNNYKINIYTDSLSSILALKSAHSRSSFVNSVKQDVAKAGNLVGLSWVKAHVGIQGNEVADQNAKQAITSGEELVIPAPRSFLNRKLKLYICQTWNTFWNNYDSASGQRVRKHINTVSPTFLINNKILIYFLSGHGPFPAYLYRFKKLNSPLCVCGQVGDAEHYTFDCSLTKDFHLTKPADAHRKAWFSNLMNNNQAIGKLTNSFRISNGVCDSLTRSGDS
ncbi:hypothetical protein AVEN_52062-1 [Araneus ventricosus]|uniref:ribonuclease H n=1 Tax=Araneus ventricosus TaxID=182803 RepID=A0A4Y2CEP3_ARAVE|nr:hypothetical protein AVEN_52062-1 [Araneus ventricosus]